jgi:hypothetical protein
MTAAFRAMAKKVGVKVPKGIVGQIPRSNGMARAAAQTLGRATTSGGVTVGMKQQTKTMRRRPAVMAVGRTTTNARQQHTNTKRRRQAVVTVGNITTKAKRRRQTQTLGTATPEALGRVQHHKMQLFLKKNKLRRTWDIQDFGGVVVEPREELKGTRAQCQG